MSCRQIEIIDNLSTGKHRSWKKLWQLSIVYAVFDACVLLVNVFKEIAISYYYEETSLAHWRFIKYPLYNMHLIFCYLLIAWVILLLMWKVFHTPAVYHARYHTLIAEERQTARRNLHRWEDSLRHDPLTGLLNRVVFQNDIQIKLIEKNARVVMIMSDLDDFKKYNDTYGHWKGDQLLKLYSHLLKNHVKELGMASRMGGDEFGAMLCFPLTDSRSRIEQTLADIYSQLSAELSEYDRQVTISMGAALAADDATTFNQLYKKTDEALYRAKENGKNRLAF